MKSIEIFEHTADIGIRLERPTRELLFNDAAMGMFHIIAPGNKFQTQIEYKAIVDGADNACLHVAGACRDATVPVVGIAPTSDCGALYGNA